MSHEVIYSSDSSPLHYTASEVEESGAKEFILANKAKLKVGGEDDVIFDWIKLHDEIADIDDLTLDLYISHSVVSGTIYGSWLRY